MPLMLGQVVLDDFEVTPGVQFGGRQLTVTHRLPAGGRIVDVIGPDESDIIWTGIISGGGAIDRVRLLTEMRRAGAVIPLLWDGFSAAVLISDLALRFVNPWWISYRIRCTLATGALSAGVPDLQTIVGQDLATAGAYIDVSAITLIPMTASTVTPGTPAYTNLLSNLTALAATLNAQIASAGLNLGSQTLANLALLAQAVAQLTAARAYISRAVSNLSRAGVP